MSSTSSALTALHCSQAVRPWVALSASRITSFRLDGRRSLRANAPTAQSTVRRGTSLVQRLSFKSFFLLEKKKCADAECGYSRYLSPDRLRSIKPETVWPLGNILLCNLDRLTLILKNPRRLSFCEGPAAEQKKKKCLGQRDSLSLYRVFPVAF